MVKIVITELILLEGGGEKIAWLSAKLPAALTGMTLHRIPVFRTDTGHISFKMPVVPGLYPASAHTVVTFDSDRRRQRLLNAVEAALRIARPDLFSAEWSA